MSTPPAEPHADPLDPVNILAELPEDEQQGFLALYRERVEEARDPAGYRLHQFLRGWAWHANQTHDPSYWEAVRLAHEGTGEWFSLEDVIRERRQAS